MEKPKAPTLEDYQRTAVLRAAVRHFLHRGESAARGAGLTPQRQLLLLMIKGAEDGDETATVTQLAERMGLRDFVEYESQRHLQIARSEHTAEAFRAFVEKRPPRFT